MRSPVRIELLYGRDARGYITFQPLCLAAAVYVKKECGHPNEKQGAPEHPYFIRPQRADLLCGKKYQHNSQKSRDQATDASQHQRRLAVMPLPRGVRHSELKQGSEHVKK